MSMNCVFDSNKECPVRKAMHESLDIKNKIGKIIKPAGDAELMKMFVPIIDKMEQTLHSEFGLLHNYCVVCRASVSCP